MDEKPKPLSFSNGGAALRKHQPPHLQHHLRPPDAALYRECLKNHAASLGGHAVDGCGEFMPSPSANPADPSSLTCAACGCHRNFHRRFLGADEDEDAPGGGESSEDEDDDEVGEHGGGAHHMLLALSTGGGMGRDPGARAAEPPRKRFRTKFTAAQKERMQELAERMGWRMQKRDEAMVEEWCRGIEVEKGVFKVWMHNNKHAFVGGSGRRGDLSAIAAAAASTGSGGGQEGGGNERNGREGSGGGDGGGANHVGNGSSGSS